jgi:hypothetical protein
MSGAPADVIWTEEWTAQILGIGRKRLRALRAEMTEGVDWTTRQKSVVFTAKGLERLREMVASEPEAAPGDNGGAPCHDPAPKDTPDYLMPPEAFWKPYLETPATWVRIRRVLANPHVLEGERTSDGAVVRLRVRPSPLWKAGMTLPCVQLESDYYQYAGKMPRYAGKWV